MKFVELKSRGGDYRVVAANVAYLRADENGQTKIGLVGGDSLLVVGSMEEIAVQMQAG
jgi:protein TonB